MMASRAALVLLTTLAVPATALQVTPNSPCSSLCIDSPDLDSSDPNSSNTRGRDIVCPDSQLDGDATGQRFKTCLTCLQGSTHAQGRESDQAWFLYNVRYAFDYCIFGYPNATHAASSPCVIPEACGTLSTALESDITTPADGSTYGYCGADGGVASGSSYESCLECVRADGQHAYLANFLVALEAGCRQKPPASLLVGVNETVFTRHSIAVTQPAPPVSSAAASSAAALSTAGIVGVAIAGLVLLALASGCAYMQVRKRQNRIRRARRTLSFRCQTAAAQRPAADDDADADYDYNYHDERFFEKRRGDEDASVGSMSPVARCGASVAPHDAGPASRALSITTSVACPEPAYAGSSAGGWSPDHVTPTASSVSPRSTASLLSPFARSPVLGPGSPVNMTKIQTAFDPPPTR